MYCRVHNSTLPNSSPIVGQLFHKIVQHCAFDEDDHQFDQAGWSGPEVVSKLKLRKPLANLFTFFQAPKTHNCVNWSWNLSPTKFRFCCDLRTVWTKSMFLLHRNPNSTNEYVRFLSSQLDDHLWNQLLQNLNIFILLKHQTALYVEARGNSIWKMVIMGPCEPAGGLSRVMDRLYNTTMQCTVNAARFNSETSPSCNI